MVNTIVAVAVAKGLIEKSSDESLKVLDLEKKSLLERVSLKELAPLPGQRFPKAPRRKLD